MRQAREQQKYWPGPASVLPGPRRLMPDLDTTTTPRIPSAVPAQDSRKAQGHRKLFLSRSWPPPRFVCPTLYRLFGKDQSSFSSGL